MTTIFNYLVTEKKRTNNSRIVNCTVMVALPLTAAGAVGNILTKSKGHSLYFRAFTITSVLGEKKLQNCTKRHYETFDVHNQRFSKIENWARKLSSLALRSAENIHCCLTLLSCFPGALACLHAARTRRTSRHCLGPSEQ
jgi:hypothetical protein